MRKLIRLAVSKRLVILPLALLVVFAIHIGAHVGAEDNDNVDSPFGFIQGGFADVAELGVHWDKPWQEGAGAEWAAVEPRGDGIYDFSKLDKTIKEAAKRKVNPYLVLKPINEKYGVIKDNGYPKKGDPGYRANWKTKLKDYVKAVVERYDADGTGDLDEDRNGVQDVPKIKYWGVGHNEVDNDSYWREKVKNYVDLVIMEYDAIKEACRDCRAVLGGASRSETAFDKGEFYHAILTELGTRCSDLVIDYHWWGAPFETKNGWAYKKHKTIVDKICELRKPTGVEPEIWTTEGGTYSDFGDATERQQAADVVKRYIYSLANGQSKLFWTRIVEYDWTDDDKSFFDHTGLINNPRNDGKNSRKLSYYTYKKLVEAFTDADWRHILPVFDNDNGPIYVYRVPRCTRGALFVVWNDDINSREITFSGLASTQAKITEAVPPYSSGEEVEYEDYANLFKVGATGTSNGELTISIGDSPLLIEEIPDTTPPTGTITINSNATYTNSAVVTLTLFATDAESGVSQMQFSNDGVICLKPEDYTVSRSYTLSSGDGVKTVYVKFGDVAGNWSDVVSNSIILDTVLPVTTSSNISDCWYNKPVSVALSVMDADSGIDKTYYSTNGANPDTLYTGSFTLSKDGVYTIKYYSIDNAGNKESVKTSTNPVKIDTTPPVGTVTINSNATYTNSAVVTLTLFATDAGSGVSQMRFSNDNNVWSIPEAYSASKSWTLLSGDGAKTVYAKFRDIVGNWSNVVSYSITLDTKGPVDAIVTINNGDTYTASTSVTLSLTAKDTGSGVSQMQFANEDKKWSTSEPFNKKKTWTLSNGGGTKTVYVRFSDKAGNLSGVVSDTIIKK